MDEYTYTFRDLSDVVDSLVVYATVDCNGCRMVSTDRVTWSAIQTAREIAIAELREYLGDDLWSMAPL